MTINWSPQLPDTIPAAHVQLQFEPSEVPTELAAIVTGLGKSPGRIDQVPQESSVAGVNLRLSLGTGSIKDCLKAARKLVSAFAKTDAKQIFVDIAPLLALGGEVSTVGSVQLSPKPDRFSAFVEGLVQGTYLLKQWAEVRIEEVLPETAIHLYASQGDVQHEMLAKAVKRAVAVGHGQLATMHLVDRPANAKRPADVAVYAEALGKQYGFSVEVLDAEALEIQGFGGILAVGRASAFPPCLIKLHYTGSAAPAYHLGLVGKGVTFDTGGISIKPNQNLQYMKSDLGGAAAVLGAFVGAAKQGLNVELSGLLPVAENAVSGNAYLPSDVIRNYGGKTIEITNTDAEGRLLLADALAYMPEFASPDFTIDLATLTGSAIQTLGYAAGALFTNDEAAFAAMTVAGDRVGERVWRLPLWEEYASDLESDVADVKHYHALPIAGAINAAKFLEYFVLDKTRWMHLDIAGVAFGPTDFTKDRAATGYGVALLLAFLNDRLDAR